MAKNISAATGKTATENAVLGLMRRFQLDAIDKWDFYGSVFKLVDARRITLRRVAELIEGDGESDIGRGIVASRRRDYLAMGGRNAH